MGTYGVAGRIVVDPALESVSPQIGRRQLRTVIVNDRCIEEEKKCMLLVMRVLSILPLTFKVGWIDDGLEVYFLN